MRDRRLGRAAGITALAAVAGGAAALVWRRVSVRPRPGHPYLAGAPLLIAHRGGSALAPENTLPAFARALDWWRADILELDVQATRDGEAVVIHDDTVDRTTDGAGAVANLTLDEIRQLDAGYRFTRDGGASYPFRARGVRVPTLAEVLEAFPDARVNIELKCAAVQEPVWHAVHRLAARRRVLIAAGELAHRARFTRYEGAISASSRELREFYFHVRARTTAFHQPRVDAFQVPEYHEGRQIVTPRFVREAHARNVAVHIWTVDDPDDMRRLLRWGVDGIITDRPDVLAQVLHEEFGRPLPPGPGEA